MNDVIESLTERVTKLENRVAELAAPVINTLESLLNTEVRVSSNLLFPAHSARAMLRKQDSPVDSFIPATSFDVLGGTEFAKPEEKNFGCGIVIKGKLVAVSVPLPSKGDGFEKVHFAYDGFQTVASDRAVRRGVYRFTPEGTFWKSA